MLFGFESSSMANAEDEHVIRKGILKHPSSNLDEGVKTVQRQMSDKKGATWDEMNILETYHPADKDYGYKKIDEPPTPYHRLSFSENDEEPAVGGDETICFNEERLAASLEQSGDAKIFQRTISADDDDNEEACLTEEEIAKRKAFEEKRKHHYNEFLEAKRLREKLEKNEDEDEAADEDNEAKTQNEELQNEELQ